MDISSGGGVKKVWVLLKGVLQKLTWRKGDQKSFGILKLKFQAPPYQSIYEHSLNPLDPGYILLHCTSDPGYELSSEAVKG